MRLARLGADFLAELLELLLGPAVGDDALDRRHRLADALNLALGLPAAADDAEGLRVGLAAPVRSWPILSASITAASWAFSVSKSTTTNGVPPGSAA